MNRLTAVLCLMLASSPAWAVNLTIETTTPARAAPVGDVDHGMLEPVDGVPIAPSRAPATYEATGRSVSSGRSSKVPVPIPNPVGVSYCDFEDLGL